MSTDVDPITFSVVRQRFDAITQEMGIVLERSAWSAIIALSRDYSCGIYDAQCRQVSMHDALPIHSASMDLVVQQISQQFAGDIHPGDAFLCNDAQSGNTHIGDLCTLVPAFADGALVAWSVIRGHQADVGAPMPTSTTPFVENVYQEGFTIPPLRIAKGGRMIEDVLKLYLANLRFRDICEGDLRAQLGAAEIGARRLEELCVEFGADLVTQCSEELLAYASRRMSQEILAIPDGTYEAVGWLDSDAFEHEDLPIRVTVTVAGDRVTVDFAGSADQTRGGVNMSFGALRAAGTIPFLHYVDPNIPHNQGCIDHVEVIAPEGSICNAIFPAATHCATFCPADLMQDVINRAMAPVLPLRVPAGGSRAANNVVFAGVDDAGVPFGVLVSLNGTGFGAAHGTDGWPLAITNAGLGAIKIPSVEQLELLFPFHFVKHEVASDSMGHGEWIGGPGSEMVMAFTTKNDIYAVNWGDGIRNPPHGAMGGYPGIGGGVYIENIGTGRKRFLSAMGENTVHGSIERWAGVSSGGGGFGLPTRRDPEQVRRDVRDGIVSRTAALEIYGVVLSDDRDPVIDLAATSLEREAIEQRQERPVTDPQGPGTATWLASHMREGDEYVLNARIDS